MKLISPKFGLWENLVTSVGSIVCLSLSEVTAQKENSPRKKVCSMIDRRKEKYIYIHFKWLGEGETSVWFLGNIYPTEQTKCSWQGFRLHSCPWPWNAQVGGQGWGQCLLRRRPSASLCQRRPDAPSLHLQSTTLLFISCLKPNLHSENS